MNVDAHFVAFLDTTVNLKPHKLIQLDERVAAIVGALQRDEVIGPLYKEHIPQGSWAHETIIEPVKLLDEFDADFLLHLTPNEDWSADPKEYIKQVRAAFKRSSTYQDMVRKKNRCVRIGYANSCHVDVVPYLVLDDGREVIVNYDENSFEETNPHGFTAWMKERDDITGGNLRKALRLLKFIRDEKHTFDCKSVILTTLVGARVQAIDAASRYADIPTTLVTLLEDLDRWLHLYDTMPLIDDPSCPGTSFNHRWTEDRYQTFKAKIATYATWAREALEAEDQATAVAAWRRLFGEKFDMPVVEEASKSLVASGHVSKSRLRAAEAAAPDEEYIERSYTFMPRYSALIDGRVKPAGWVRFRPIRTGRPLDRNSKLEFTVKTDAPGDFEVIWKVRNRGDAAARVPGGLRGQLLSSNAGRLTRKEETKYPGQHYVEVYIVKNGIVVASDHHEVVIR